MKLETLALLLAVALVLPLGLSAAEPGTDDLIYQPGFLAVPDAAPVATWTPPADYDTKIALSDRSLNLVVSGLLKKGKASPTGKRLEHLALSTSQEGYLSIDGVFASDGGAGLPAGRFAFKLLAFLHSSKGNAICFDVSECSVYLQNGKPSSVYQGGTKHPEKIAGAVRVFHSDAANPAPLATILDFLAPSLEKQAADQIEAAQKAVHENLAAKFAGTGRPQVGRAGVEQVLEIDGNRIVLRILPELFMPVMPAVHISYVTIHDRKITLFADFQDGGEDR